MFKKLQKFILIFLSALLVGSLMSLVLIALFPTPVAQFILTKMNFPQVKFDQLQITWALPIGVQLSGLRFQIGEKDNSLWEFRVKTIDFDLATSSLFDRKLKIFKLHLSQMKVALTETNPIKKRTPNKKKSTDFPDWIFIDKLSITNSTFTYRDQDRHRKRNDGSLTFSKIALDSQNLSKKLISKQGARFKAQGKLQEASINIDLTVKVSTHDQDITMKTKISNASLSSINSYSLPVEGLALSGKIHEAYSHSTLVNGKLVSTVRISYQDLEVDVESNNKRNLVESIIGDMVLNSKLCDSNQKRGGIQSVSKDTSQKGDESIANFLLFGLLRSALKEACLNT